MVFIMLRSFFVSVKFSMRERRNFQNGKHLFLTNICFGGIIYKTNVLYGGDNMMRNILHIDMNNCFASIECLINPSIRGKAVAVCGSVEQRRGIILAKNDKAKAFDVRTAETIWEAKKKCPELVLVPPHYDIYMNFSRRAKQIYLRYTDRVEAFGMDECWLDVTGTRREPKEVADEIREAVKAELGITVSVGASFNKIFAKLGSDMKKPDATTVISYENFKEKIWGLSAEELLFIGKSTKRILNCHGIKTIGDLAQTPVKFLESWLGKRGKALWEYANGLDNSPVNYIWEKVPIKSVSNGTTAVRDLKGAEEVRVLMAVMAETVGARLRKLRLKAYGISICVRDSSMRSHQAQCKLTSPTYDDLEIIKTAMELFCKHFESKDMSIRAVTVGAFDLADEASAVQMDMYVSPVRLEKREAINKAVDNIRARYGFDSIHMAQCKCRI